MSSRKKLMKLLLIAYEYPPIIAAQSLRWYYLANELAKKGVTVHLLTTNIHDLWNFSGVTNPDIIIHRCYPGPFVASTGWLFDKVSKSKTLTGKTNSKKQSSEFPQLTKGKFYKHAYDRLRNFLNQVIFPDVRTEWLPFAWKKINQLIKKQRFDLIISSHEPGVDLILGILVQSKYHLPWIIDLADPLATPYTPSWRKFIDKWFEKLVCNRADRIIVTNDALADILEKRHNVTSNAFQIIPQGFDGKHFDQPHKKNIHNKAHTFTMAFTGNFYADFRHPQELIDALKEIPDIHFIVAGNNDQFRNILDNLGHRLIMYPVIDHFQCLEIQRSATVLVNIGNSQPDQVPGKLYEYFGAQRPILHIYNCDSDPVIDVLSKLNRGVTVPNNKMAIQHSIETLVGLWEKNRLDENFNLSLESVRQYCWKEGAIKVLNLGNELINNAIK